jgi:hypothetical protein
MGFDALGTNFCGSDNIALGACALRNNQTNSNIAIGGAALQQNTNGTGNTAIGRSAGTSNTSGSNNVGVGYAALGSTTIGSSNVAVGYNAGCNLTTGCNNIVIGTSALASTAASSNETTIGTSTTTVFRAFGDLQLQRDYTEKVVTANTGTAYTIDITAGTIQILTLTGSVVFTFPAATSGKSFVLLLKQDGTGSRTVTWPSVTNPVKWPSGTAPTITSTASRLDKYVFTADGTNWYGSNAGQNYTP